MTRDTIIANVQARMSDIIPSSQTEVVSYPFVDTLLDGAVEGFFLLVPLNLLPKTDIELPGSPRDMPSDEVIITRIAVPDTFIRLITFRCDGWNRAVNNVLSESSPQHYAQIFKHTFGGNNRPQVTLVNDELLGRAIEFYNYLGTTPTITAASCVIKCDPTLIPNNIIYPYCYYVAYLAFDAMGEEVAAKAALQHVQEFIELNK